MQLFGFNVFNAKQESTYVADKDKSSESEQKLSCKTKATCWKMLISKVILCLICLICWYYSFLT